MRPETRRFYDRPRGMKWRGRPIAWALLLLAAGFAPAGQAQQQGNDKAAAASDLTLQNQSRVAASALEIRAILEKDAGLMVELKHWVAKDASDHGQILSDADLNDDAIFARLDDDIQFRSIATALVQRYGYLLPKLNPDSDIAKRNDLLIQERTKWLAQEQEEISCRPVSAERPVRRTTHPVIRNPARTVTSQRHGPRLLEIWSRRPNGKYRPPEMPLWSRIRRGFRAATQTSCFAPNPGNRVRIQTALPLRSFSRVITTLP